MKIHKTAISLTLIGLFAANVASALPEFTKEAPQSSIDTCVAEVDSFAYLEDAKSVIHNVETKERRVSGHKMHIQTSTARAMHLFASTQQTARSMVRTKFFVSEFTRKANE
jgi:hypothetical protein